MSEQLTVHSPEQTVEAPVVAINREATTHSAAEQAQQLEIAQAAVAAESSPAQPALPVIDDRPQLIDSSIKHLRLQQNIAKMRARLTPSDRAFSKVIHQPLISRASAAAAQTISRPSGMLGGSIAAFAGSVVYLYLAHHVGFSYNYLLFSVFFVGGFSLGVLGEYAAYRLRRLSARKINA